MEYLVDLGQRATGRRPVAAGLQFTVPASQALMTVAPDGEVDAAAPPNLLAKVQRVAALGPQRLTVDHSGVGFMDSIGMGAVLADLGRVPESAGEMVLRSPRPRTPKVLEIAGIDRTLPDHLNPGTGDDGGAGPANSSASSVSEADAGQPGRRATTETLFASTQCYWSHDHKSWRGLEAVRPLSAATVAVMLTAEHPLPLLLRRDGAVAEIVRPGGLRGFLADMDVSKETFEHGLGDAQIPFTDGISERRHSGRFFEEDLPSVLAGAAGASASDLAEVVRDEAVALTTEAPDDDMALLVLSVPTVGHTATPKPSDSCSVAGTRR